jgi:hypothetical protein
MSGNPLNGSAIDTATELLERQHIEYAGGHLSRIFPQFGTMFENAEMTRRWADQQPFKIYSPAGALALGLLLANDDFLHGADFWIGEVFERFSAKPKFVRLAVTRVLKRYLPVPVCLNILMRDAGIVGEPNQERALQEAFCYFVALA